jgi:hypothetical protein
MNGLLSFLQFLDTNWTMLLAILTLIVALYFKAKSAFNKWLVMTDQERQKDAEEQIQRAKQAIANYILSLVAAAEDDWAKYGHGLGAIKRAQVIEKIYKDYPILLKVVDQEELMQFIDAQIDFALETVREKLRKVAEGEEAADEV